MRLAIVLALCACGSSTPAPAPPSPAPHDHTAHTHQHDFKDAEQWAAKFDAPDRAAWQQPEQVVALMELQATDTVADIGAGTGYFLPYLARAVPHGKVLALDVEPAMVEHMKRRIAREQLANVEPRAVAPADPGLPPDAVNKILVVDTWHHIPDRVAYARLLAAALSACSTSPAHLVIVDFTADSPIGPPAAARLAPESIVAELTAAGLQARIATETLPHQYVIVAVRTPPARCSVGTR